MEPNPINFSPLIIGTMRLGQWGAKMNTLEYQQFIEGCLELELTDFDHADICGDYTTEKEFGEVLKIIPSLRSQMQIISKCGIKMLSANRPFHKIKSYDTSRTHIINSVNNSLRNLNTDYLDVLLIHRPDLLLDINEIAETFFDLKKSGKVLHFGVSNFSPNQFNLLNDAFPMCTNQVEASILHLDAFQDGSLDLCQKLNISPTIWSPFGGGIIFDELNTDARLDRIKSVCEDILKKHDASLDQILIAWLRKHPSSPVPVLGTSKLSRISSLKKALDINLSREEWYQVFTASTGEEVA